MTTAAPTIDELIAELAAQQGPKDTAPKGGKLWVDVHRGIIYGVLLLARKSSNGYDYTEQAIEAAHRLSNRTKVQEGHYPRHGAAHMNGQIRSPYRDGPDLRGAWHLNLRNPNTQQYLLDALEFPENLALSIETLKKNTPEKLNKRTGRIEVQDVKAIEWYAIENDGGVARSLSQRRYERRKPMSEINTIRELRTAYPDLVGQIEADCARRVEADCSCKNESAISVVEQERDKYKSELDAIKSQQAKADRLEEIKAEWSELIKDVKPEALPERLRNQLTLADEELQLFLDQEPVIVTSTLTGRATAITEAARTIEANTGNHILERRAESSGADADYDNWQNQETDEGLVFDRL